MFPQFVSMFTALGDVTPIVPTVPTLSGLITSATFQPIIDMILSILPAILGFSLGMGAIRIAIRWVNGTVSGKKKG